MKPVSQLCSAVFAAALLAGGAGCLAEFPDGPEAKDARPRFAPDVSTRDASELTGDVGQAVDGTLSDSGSPHDAQLSDAVLPDVEVDAEIEGPDAAEPHPEICDDVDNDLDGATDEGGVCGAYVAEHCQAWLGFAGGGGLSASPDNWGDCPQRTRDNSGLERCVGTLKDGRFASLILPGLVGLGDQMSVRFTCEDPELPLGVWVQRHCAFAIGVARDNDRSGEGNAAWAGCPSVNRDTSGNLSCAATGGDGRFHTADYVGYGTSDDRLAVSFYCHDTERPGLAARITSEVEVFLGFRYAFLLEVDSWHGADTWVDCPGRSLDDDGADRCVGSHGDGLFHGMSLVSGILLIHTPGVLSIALKQR